MHQYNVMLWKHWKDKAEINLSKLTDNRLIYIEFGLIKLIEVYLGLLLAGTPSLCPSYWQIHRPFVRPICRYTVPLCPSYWSIRRKEEITLRPGEGMLLKGVFAKNVRRYRLTAKNNHFLSLLILLLSVASLRENC